MKHAIIRCTQILKVKKNTYVQELATEYKKNYIILTKY